METPLPDFQTAIAAWILAGGAHHTGFSKVVTTEMMEDFAEMADIEFLVIDENTDLREFKKELRWNEVYYKIKNKYRAVSRDILPLNN